MKQILVENIIIGVREAHDSDLKLLIREKIRKKIHPAEHVFISIHRKSLDARRKANIHYVIKALVEVDNAFPVDRYTDTREHEPFRYGNLERGSEPLPARPIVVGSGPCGLFCAYLLSLYGYRPVILERGKPVEERHKAVSRLWREGILHPETNVQFGEGGAGAYSDGKLITRINDRRSLFVLETFHRFGAGEAILYDARPHIGTDRLASIVKNLRQAILSNGGEFFFDACVDSLDIRQGRIRGVGIRGGGEMEANVLVLATGHSARDTYGMLHKMEFSLRQKPFSAGVRIEHPQEAVDESQYGKSGKYISEKAEYGIWAKIGSRTAYSFCMCPGGQVINASSEPGCLTVNGMSNEARSLCNANSAWVVSVFPSDFSSSHPLSGIDFQREMEKKAFEAGGGGYGAPVQRMEDFLMGRTCGETGSVRPSFTGETRRHDLNLVLPGFIASTLKASVRALGGKMQCFPMGDAILTGCETRTSSPVRVVRDEQMMAEGIDGVYPAGEGAGYAGGITSAAVDGMRVAEKIIGKYCGGG
ncbi:MAG: NAD(P)-binding protein [Clostridia bacterium]